MSAENFFNKQKDALKTVNKKLEEKGKKLSTLVESNVSNTVDESLNTIISDFKSTIGAVTAALSGGIGGLISSVQNAAESAIGNALSAISSVASLGGLLGNGIKFELPTFKIGNLEINAGELSGLVENAASQVANEVENVNKTLLQDQVTLPTRQPNPTTKTNQFGETVVQNTAEATRLAQQGAIPEGTVVRTREENTYVVVSSRLDSKGDTPQTIQEVDEVGTTSRLDTKGVTPLYEYNKQKVKNGEKAVFPPGGQKAGPKVDGVPVVNPKPEPPEKTASSKEIYENPTKKLSNKLDNEEADSRLTGQIQQLKNEMNNAVAVKKQELIDSGEEFYDDDPRIESIYSDYENRIAALEAEREQVRSQAPAGPSSDADFDAALNGNDDSFDAALNGESTSSTGSSVPTTSTTTTETTSTETVTETGGEASTTGPGKMTEAQRAADMEEFRKGQEENVMTTKYSSEKRANGGIKRLNGKYYPNRKYEAYESDGGWYVRRIK